MEYLIILIGAVFVNNIVLSQFLGICPFLGVSNKVSTSVGMSGAVLFVMTIATTVTYLLHQYVLVPMGLDYLRTITFILVIAALVQMVEIMLKKVSPPLYQALGVFLPLITTNCAVLGVAILAPGRRKSTEGGLLCCFQFGRVCPGTDCLCKYPGVPGTGGHPRGNEGSAHQFAGSRAPFTGLSGLCRVGIKHTARPFGFKLILPYKSHLRRRDRPS